LAGRTLTRCDIRVPKYATVDLTGQVVDEVISRGKHLFIRIGSASIHSHLKMEGSWKVSPVSKPNRAGYGSGSSWRRATFRRLASIWECSKYWSANTTSTRSPIWVPTCSATTGTPTSRRRT